MSKKSILNAYVFWLLTGWASGHRFYAGRAGSALFQVMFLWAGAAVFLFSIFGNLPQLSAPGAITAGVGLLWLVCDLVLIPGMIGAYNARFDREPGRFIHGPVDLDPSFKATLARAGADPAKQKPSGIPDGYEMPWRGDNPRGAIRRYRPGEDDPDPADDRQD